MRERRQHALRVEMDEVEQLVRAVADLLSILHSVRARRVVELLPDRDDRVERIECRLEHHRCLGPAVLAEVVVIQRSNVGREPVLRVEDLALGHLRAARREADESDRQRRLSRAALADDRKGLALLELERHVAHGMDRPLARDVVDGEVADGEDWHGR